MKDRKHTLMIGLLALASAAAVGSAQAHGRHHSTGYWADEDYRPALEYRDHRRHVRTRAARQHCWEVPAHHSHHPDAQLGGTIAGAIIGGLVGNQFGKGRGKDLATVGGALVGAELGRQATETRHTSDPVSHTVIQCHTVHPHHHQHRHSRHHRYNDFHD